MSSMNNVMCTGTLVQIVRVDDMLLVCMSEISFTYGKCAGYIAVSHNSDWYWYDVPTCNHGQ